MKAKQAVAEESGTQEHEWEFTNGPHSGVGEDFWLVNEKRGLEAYVCVDQGEVISCEINPIT